MWLNKGQDFHENLSKAKILWYLWNSFWYTYSIFSLPSSKSSATKYTGWYSVIGYFCKAVLAGSKGRSSGFPLRAYSSSPNEERRPAPYTFSSPCCRQIPYSTVNQKHWKLIKRVIKEVWPKSRMFDKFLIFLNVFF